jgi:hypothetical protein
MNGHCGTRLRHRSLSTRIQLALEMWHELTSSGTVLKNAGLVAMVFLDCQYSFWLYARINCVVGI